MEKKYLASSILALLVFWDLTEDSIARISAILSKLITNFFKNQALKLCCHAFTSKVYYFFIKIQKANFWLKTTFLAALSLSHGHLWVIVQEAAL